MSQQKAKNQLKTKIKKILFSLVAIAFISGGCLTVQLLISFLSYTFATTTDESYPTSLPWIGKKSDCENRGRKWYDNKCWDGEHNLLF
jgi:hypothetical protein